MPVTVTPWTDHTDEQLAEWGNVPMEIHTRNGSRTVLAVDWQVADGGHIQLRRMVRLDDDTIVPMAFTLIAAADFLSINQPAYAYDADHLARQREQQQLVAREMAAAQLRGGLPAGIMPAPPGGNRQQRRHPG